MGNKITILQLVTAMCICAISLKGQMITPDKVWHVEQGMACAESYDGCFCYTGTTTIKVGNTRTFDGKDYYEIISSTNGSDDEITTHVREEGDKVFFYACGHEYLMYDFGVDVGDEIYLANPYHLHLLENGNNCHDLTDSDYSKFTVTGIDTIEYANISRKRITLLPPTSEIPEYWIEGIGCIRGLYFTIVHNMSGAKMLKDCYVSDMLVFENEYPEFTWCTDDINDNVADKIEAFVDANNILHITNVKDLYLSIYNLQGQLMRSFVPDSNDFYMNIASFPSGLYVIKCNDNNESIKVYNP